MKIVIVVYKDGRSAVYKYESSTKTDEKSFKEYEDDPEWLTTIVLDEKSSCDEFVKVNLLTKREYFAGLAMRGMLSFNANKTADFFASEAVEIADALLKELENKTP